MKNIKLVLGLIILSLIILILTLFIFLGANGERINLIKQESNAIEENIIDLDYSDVFNGDYRMEMIHYYSVYFNYNITYPNPDSNAQVTLGNPTVSVGYNGERFKNSV